MSHPRTHREALFQAAVAAAKRERRRQLILDQIGFMIVCAFAGFSLEALTWVLHDHYSKAIPEAGYWTSLGVFMLLRLLYFAVSLDYRRKN